MSFSEMETAYALLAANVYGVTNNDENGLPRDRSDRNTLPLPGPGWSIINERRLDSGYMARAYRGPSGQVVISYAGTTSGIEDWVTGNIPAGGGLLALQVIQASQFYLDVLNSEGPLTDITFTGHSLGGGLASLMAVYFNRQATVFDQAPFALSADNPFLYAQLVSGLTLLSYDVPSELGGYIPLITMEPRKENVHQIFVTGEVLSYISGNYLKINGEIDELDPQAIATLGWGGGVVGEALRAVDLHSMSLLTGFMLSSEFLNAVKNHKEILPRIFKGAYSDILPTNKAESSLLDLLVQRQAKGERSLDALAHSIQKITGSGLSSTIATFTSNQRGSGEPILMTLAVALVDVVLAGLYAQGKGRLPADSFTAMFNDVLFSASGGLQFDTQDLGAQVDRGIGALRDYVFFMSQDSVWNKEVMNKARWLLQNGTGALLYESSDSDLRSDVIIGIEGANVLKSGGGDDIIIGGQEVDDITGGAGNDTLVGGFGADSYRFWSNDSSLNTVDTVIDSWGDGTIYFDNVPVTAGERISESSWYDSTKKLKLTYVASGTGGMLIISNIATGDTIRVQSWSGGELGITLAGDVPQVAPGTALTNDADVFGETGTNAGTDIVNGLAGNDGIEGGAGNDYLDGGENDDLIFGGSGNDRIIGGDGNDLIVDGSERIDMRELRTTIDGDGTSELQRFNEDIARLGSSVIARGASWYTYRTEGGAATGDATLDGAVTILIPSHTNLDPESAPSGDDFIDAGAGSDRVLSGEGDDILIGGSGNDFLIGGHDNDVINGGADNDEIYGDLPSDMVAGIDLTALVSATAVQNGADVLDGGDGEDTIRGGGGNDVISGGEGDDFLMGLGGGFVADANDLDSDYIDGGSGNDQIVGNAGDDTLLGGADNDTIFGDDDQSATMGGNDVIAGGDGDDALIGQGGNDRIFGEQGADTIQGDSFALDGSKHGNDLISAGTENDLVLGMGGNDVIYGDDGDDVLLGDAEIVQLSEQFHGDDLLYGGAGADVLKGGSGHDSLYGGNDADQLFGENGNDVLDGGAGIDILSGDAGNDRLSGGGDNDQLWGGDGEDFLSGGDGLDQLVGGEGNDSLDGGADNDTLFGQAGNDTLYGGVGDDGLQGDDGTDTLNGGDGADQLFGNAGQDYLSGENGNDILVGGTENDQLFGGAGVDTLHGEDGDDILDGGSENDTLYSGNGNDSAYGGSGVDQLAGGDGDDTLDGGSEGDTLIGGEGNDTLLGGEGDDLLDGGTGVNTYIVGPGLGYDRIFSLYGGSGVPTGAPDASGSVLRIAGGVLPGDVTVEQSGLDARLTFPGGSVAIQDFFFAGAGANYSPVTSIVFDNGTVWNVAHVSYLVSIAGTSGNDYLSGSDQDDVISGQAGDDTIYGNGGNDTLRGNAGSDQLDGGDGNDRLDGGEGNDYLYGGDGNDIYVFGVGYGSDQIDSSDASGFDVVELSGLAPNDVQVTTSYYNLTLTISETGETLNILNYLRPKESGGGYVGEIRFSDGTIWTIANIVAMFNQPTDSGDWLSGSFGDDVISGGGGNDSIDGYAGQDWLDGGTGNDTIRGGEGDDVLAGGVGNDTVYGGEGNDCFVFSPGTGSDTIRDYASGDRIQVSGVSRQEIQLTRNEKNLYIGFVGSSDVLTLENYFLSVPGPGLDVELDGEDLILDESAVNSLFMQVSENDDVIYGTSYDDVIAALGGNDRVEGGLGNDHIAGGTGLDSLYGGSGNDELNGGEGDDDLYGGEGNDTLNGGDGADSLLGDAGNDLLQGGAGNDSLRGGGGSNTYFFLQGFGTDTISLSESSESGTENAILHFAGGITASSLQLERDALGALVIRIGNESVKIDGFYARNAVTVSFTFDDGSSLSVAQSEYLQAYTGTAGINSITSSGFDDVIFGQGGDDTINAWKGNDVISGGRGSDTLDGGAGNDDFIYQLGDGSDRIIGDKSGFDRLLFGQGISVSDVTFYRESASTSADLIAMLGDGSMVKISVDSSSNKGIDEFRFSDGSFLTFSQAMSAAVLLPAPITINGSGVIDGNAYANAIYGSSGNDEMHGHGGDDTYYAGCDTQYGYDSVVEGVGEGIDTVYMRNNGYSQAGYALPENVENLVVSYTGESRLYQYDSSTNEYRDIYLYRQFQGNSLDNVLDASQSSSMSQNRMDGGGGSDVMIGGAGRDIFVVDSAEDVVMDVGGRIESWQGSAFAILDTVEAHISYSIDGNDRIEGVSLLGAATTATGNALSNRLDSSEASLECFLIGKDGDDEYLIKEGDHVIEGSDAGRDSVVLEYGRVDTFIAPSISNVEKVILGASTANSGLVGGSSDDYLIGNCYSNAISGGEGNDQIEDTQYSPLFASYDNDYLEGGAGNDVIRSWVGTDVIVGGTGDDELSGASNNATYKFSAGDGHDRISEYAGVDVIEFDSTVDPGNVWVSRSGNDLLVSYTGGSITVGSYWEANGADANSIEWIRFALNDGSQLNWSRSDVVGMINNLHLTGGESVDSLIGDIGADLLEGFGGNDYLYGGKSDDRLRGGAGSDIYAYDIGDGDDTIFEGQGEQGEYDVLQLGQGILTDNVRVWRNTRSAEMWVEVSGAKIYLDSAQDGSRLEKIQFADGTIWDVNSIAEQVNFAPNGPGSLSFRATHGEAFSINVRDYFTDDDALSFEVIDAPQWLYFDSETGVLSGQPSATDGVFEFTIVATDTGGLSATAYMDVVVPQVIEGTSAADVLTGTQSDEDIYGFGGGDTLDGGGGMDSLFGGLGDDTYIVNDSYVEIFENTSEGIDLVKASVDHRLDNDVENVTLVGSSAIYAKGNDLDNVLTGNSAANELQGYGGNDTLDGGAGNDYMEGGLGNDTYIVGSTGDEIFEYEDEGVDLVKSSKTYTLGDSLENVTLTGSSGINATGNALDNVLVGNSAANILAGGDGNDTIDGGAGNDTMVGGLGDDVYVVNSTADVTTEQANQGMDTVRSSITLTLAGNVENLVLTGTSVINGTGNVLDNVLTGNSGTNSLTGGVGNDTLDGAAGTDTLTGGAGSDTYLHGRGYGADTAVENDATAGVTDIARFLTGVSYDQLWFAKPSGTNNLEISIIGTSDKLTIKDWYVGSQYRVEEIRTVDGNYLLTAANVQTLVNKMATMTKPTTTTLSASQRSQLESTFASTWVQQQSAMAARTPLTERQVSLTTAEFDPQPVTAPEDTGWNNLAFDDPFMDDLDNRHYSMSLPASPTSPRIQRHVGVTAVMGPEILTHQTPSPDVMVTGGQSPTRSHTVQVKPMQVWPGNISHLDGQLEARGEEGHSRAWRSWETLMDLDIPGLEAHNANESGVGIQTKPLVISDASARSLSDCHNLIAMMGIAGRFDKEAFSPHASEHTYSLIP